MAATIEEATGARRAEVSPLSGLRTVHGTLASTTGSTRIEAYKKAGVDMLMLFSRNPEEVRHIHERLGGPF